MPLITDTKKLASFCKKLGKEPFITIDTEFLRDKTYYPKLCLVQLSNPKGEAAGIDPLAGDIDLEPLFELLFNKDVLKVFHAARQDLEIFYHLTSKVVEPFFDTQIAAMVCGYGDSVGYENLVRNITGNSLDKSVQFTDWSRRPLSKKQIDYALGDVTYLCDIYRTLSKELEDRDRISWVYQEEEILAAPETYENLPEDVWKRVKVKSPKPKTLAVLRELAAWREKQAQNKNIPRTWVLRDETLADMAAQMPENASQLKKIRNMPEDLAKNQVGKTLLELIQKAVRSDKKTWPKPEKKQPLAPHISATIDILKMLLKIQSAEHGVAAKLLASQDDLKSIALEDKPDVPAMKGWRFEIFGRDALALKAGNISIGLKKSSITKYKVTDKSDVYE